MAITSKQFLARALLWKQKYKIATTFRDPEYEGGKSYPYEGEDKYAIFNWFRREFPYYNRFLDTEELTQRFFDDYQRGDPLLLKDIAEQTVPAEPSASEPTAGVPEQAGVGIPPMPTFSRSPTITRVSPPVTGPLKTAGKNLATDARIGIKKGLTRVGGGFSNILGGVGRGFGGILGGIGGGGVRLISGAGGALSSISTQMTRKPIIGISGRFLLIFLLGFLLVGTLTAFTPTPQQQQPSPTSVYTPGAGSGIISCPLNGAVTITNGSKEAGGHCSPSYETAYGVCTKPGSTGYTGRDTAIDVTSSDRLVYLPRVQGAGQAKWIVDEAGNVPITEGEGGGISVAAHTTVNNKTYRLRFVHIESTNLKIGDTVDVGTAVGQYYLNNPYGAHVHIIMQEDGVFKPADTYFNLCK